MNDTSPSTPKSMTTNAWITTLIWLALLTSALILRPLLPIDETRYITVAWEMWSNKDFWVPTLNGEVYSHKPPFLFWFMHLGWAILGVSEIWARLVAPLFGLGVLFLTTKLARALWPTASTHIQNSRAQIAPMMLVTGLYWAVFSTMTMFDMLVTFGAVLALLGYVKTWQGYVTGVGFWRGILIAGIGIGIGGLAKGPAVLVHTLPVALLAPYWGPFTVHGRGTKPWRTWYTGVLISVLIGLALTLAWAVPAALIGGPEYRDAIFIKQSTDRMVKSFAHRRPFYWFAMVLPVLLLPWTLWPRLWKAVGFRKAWQNHSGVRASLQDGSVRFLLICFGASFVIFSAISGKQPHYLLPVFPALALFAAYMLTRENANDDVKSTHHKVPLYFLAGLLTIILIGLLSQDLIDPLLKRPLPSWARRAEPLWLIPTILLAIVCLRIKTKDAQIQVRLIAITVTATIVSLYMVAAPALNIAYNLEVPAQQVKAFQDQGRPIAYIGKYHGEFQFLGRLTKPLTPLQNFESGQVWAKQHPTGVVISAMHKERIPKAAPTPVFSQAYRGRIMLMWNAKDF